MATVLDLVSFVIILFSFRYVLFAPSDRDLQRAMEEEFEYLTRLASMTFDQRTSIRKQLEAITPETDQLRRFMKEIDRLNEQTRRQR